MLFSSKHDNEEKKTALPYKRKPIFKITLQKSHFGSLFFFSVQNFAGQSVMSISDMYLLLQTEWLVPTDSVELHVNRRDFC